MTKFRFKSVWVIRNLNLDIVWDLVLVIWCFGWSLLIPPFGGDQYPRRDQPAKGLGVAPEI